MGNVLAAKKDYEGAIKEFEEALKLTDNKTAVWASIVKVHLSEGKPDLALQKIAEYKKQSPDDTGLYQLAAEVYMSKKQFDSAEKELNRAVELKPDWDMPYLNLAAIKMEQKDLKGAIAVYEQGLKNIPDSEKLVMMSATSYERTGDYEKAISAYEKTLDINSRNVLAANNLAALILDHRDDQQSYMKAKELVKSLENTNQPALLDTVAWADYKLGNLESAIATLQQVVEKAPAVPIFQYHLGMAYHKQGNKAAAKTHLETALNSNQDFAGKKQAQDILNQIE
jgi:tetratricopeptide (TPR) repeat protein